MKNTLSLFTFAIIATTSSLAFGVADPCFNHQCAENEVCEFLSLPECVCPPSPGGEGNDPAPCDCEPAGQPAPTCVPAPPPECNSDADCSSDAVCVTYSYGSCHGSDGTAPQPDEGVACDQTDEGCEPPPKPQPDPICTEETESICVPKYAAPCQTASDCGSGFTCETPEICTCTNGAPIDAEDQSECPDMPEDDCTCAPSEGDAYCQLIEVPCTSDTDCQDEFSCQAAYGGEEVGTAFACESDCDDADPVPPSLFCLPDGFNDWREQGGNDEVAGRKVESSERTGFFPDNNLGGGGKKADGGGCSVSQGPTGFAAGTLMLLGMMFGFRRKK